MYGLNPQKPKKPMLRLGATIPAHAAAERSTRSAAALELHLRRTVLSLGIGIADALDAAYAAGIVPPRHQACKHLRDQARARQDSRFRTSESRGGQIFKPDRRGRYADTI